MKGMERKRTITVPIFVAVMLVALVAYVASYFLVGSFHVTVWPNTDQPLRYRRFPNRILAMTYSPLVHLERGITGRDIKIVVAEDEEE
jgi:hypothetical protein